MTIIVGTNSYITLEDARKYLADFGLTPLPLDDIEAEALLIRAAASMDRMYGSRYLGQIQAMAQPMAWPRYVAPGSGPCGYPSYPDYPFGPYENFITYDSYGNPRDFSGLQPELGWAQSQLTVNIQSNQALFTQPSPAIKSITEKVSTLLESIEYANSNGYKPDAYYDISLILQPLLRVSNGALAITRGA